MKLSKDFYLSEFTASATADQRGLPNEPSIVHIVALTALANVILQPIRSHYKSRVIISSGYRGPALNTAIGGSMTSQHSLGEATDFTVEGCSCKEVAEWIAYESGLDFDQLIWERQYDKDGKVIKEWLHISYVRTGGNRRQVLSAYVKPEGTEYVAGLR